MVRRGFTLVEVVLAACLTAIIVGALTLLFGFSYRQISESATTFAITDQTRRALQDIAATAEQAITCQTVTQNGQTALKCLMPALGTGGARGYFESYLPSSISPRGIERYVPGNRVWFYLSDSTGTFGAAGTTLWRALRTDDNPPLASDADRLWTFYGGTGPPSRPLISELSFAVDAVAHTATVGITASSMRSVETPADRMSGPIVGTTLTRTVYWRAWRP